MTRALFNCSRNRLRSPTAEAVFAGWPGVETDSAGLAPDADTQVCVEQLEWAEIVFVMERAHKARLTARFGARLKHKKIVCLDIPHPLHVHAARAGRAARTQGRAVAARMTGA